MWITALIQAVGVVVVHSSCLLCSVNTAALTSRSTFSAVNPAQINAVVLIILFLMEFTEVLI